MPTTTVNSKVVSELLEKTRVSSGMFYQRVYKDILRNLISIFGNTYYTDRNNNPIKVRCFHAYQERAIAKATVGDNITLPVISISETNTTSNEERRRYSPLLVHETYWHRIQNRAIRTLSLSPKPVDISYNINIWTKYKQDLDQIREYIYLLFNPDLEIKTNESNITKAYIVSESDVEQDEAEDTQDRILKKSISIKVETYIPSPKFLYTSTGKIESMNYELAIEGEENISTSECKANCACKNCLLPINLIDGSQSNLNANCELIQLSLINGQEISLDIDCNAIITVDGTIGS